MHVKVYQSINRIGSDNNNNNTINCTNKCLPPLEVPLSIESFYLLMLDIWYLFFCFIFSVSATCPVRCFVVLHFREQLLARSLAHRVRATKQAEYLGSLCAWLDRIVFGLQWAVALKYNELQSPCSLVGWLYYVERCYRPFLCNFLWLKKNHASNNQKCWALDTGGNLI